MANDVEFVQIEANEDATSVRDRLTFIRGKRVLLIWPEEGTALTRKLDLVLIQREAMRRAIRLAFATHDPEVIRHAKELDISAFETIGASERGRWKRGRAKVFTNRYQRPKDEKDPGDLMDVASRVRLKRRGLSGFWRFTIRVGILLVLFGAVAAVGYAFIPKATVTLIPAEQSITTTVEINVNPNPTFVEIDVENAILPATILRLEIEDTASIAATGTQDLGNVQALGSVLFVNQTNNAITIPTGTTISTSAGTPSMFRTTEDVTLTAGNGEQTEAPIEAMPSSAGGIGNVDENLINTVIGPLENSVSVINLAPTSGGVSRTETAVTESDRERLLILMRQQLQARAFDELMALPEVSNTHFVIIETLRIAEERNDWTNFSANPGDIADTLSLEMRAIIEAVAVDEKLAQQIVFAQMARQIPRGRVIKPESVEYERGPIVINGDDIKFTMTGSGLVAGQINAEQIRSQLAGRSIDDAMTYLTERVDIDENSVPQIEVSPDLFGRMPLLGMRIDIVIVQIVAGDSS
jgi:hypothetical protein